jgi:hypothetical protein
MTRRQSHSFPAPFEVDLGMTRSRFLFARAQTSAHGSAADYLRMRDTSRGAPASASGEDGQTSSSAT